MTNIHCSPFARITAHAADAAARAELLAVLVAMLARQTCARAAYRGAMWALYFGR